MGKRNVPCLSSGRSLKYKCTKLIAAKLVEAPAIDSKAFDRQRSQCNRLVFILGQTFDELEPSSRIAYGPAQRWVHRDEGSRLKAAGVAHSVRCSRFRQGIEVRRGEDRASRSLKESSL